MRRYKIILFAFLSFSLFSCVKEYLDKTPDEDMTLEEVFSKREFAFRYLTNLYTCVPNNLDFHTNGGQNPFVGASELEITWPSNPSHQLTAGSWNVSGDILNMWSANLASIRDVNIFLERIGNVPMDETEKRVWVGEAIFLRAFFHFLLMRAYGPIPIVDESYKIDTDFNSIKRNTLDECVDFVIGECNNAMDLLSPTRERSDLGRATSVAAAALKARLLLYAASPLWNGNPDYLSLANKDGRRLFPDFNEGKWAVAATAAKECIDLAIANGYKLYRSESDDPVANYHEMSIINHNKEVLFARNSGRFTLTETRSTPNGMGGHSGYAPLLELVDAYQMADGSTPILGYTPSGQPIINTASGYQETGFAAAAHPKGWHPTGIRNMFFGREPRFYASIHYAGSMWRGRTIEFWNSGLDGRSKSGVDYSKTGFLMKKFSDENVRIPQNIFTNKTWVFFRLGEIFLNYAEALNESQGPVSDVYYYVNEIRSRAGLPDLQEDLTQEEMQEKIRHERRIELAFEGHRYFDVRRWKIATETDGGNFYSLNVGAGISRLDIAFYQRIFLKTRVFDPSKHYLWPIPQSDINLMSNMVQNPGWR